MTPKQLEETMMPAVNALKVVYHSQDADLINMCPLAGVCTDFILL